MLIIEGTAPLKFDQPHTQLRRRRNGEEAILPYFPRSRSIAKETTINLGIKGEKIFVSIWMNGEEKPKDANG